MRFVGKSRLGFYPLPLSEAQRIRRFLLFPDQPSSALDPCIGDGVAFEAITGGAHVLRYGIELDAYRAEQATQRIHNIVQGNTLEVQCSIECVGLLYLNPPYDWTLGPADSRRTEQSFLSHTYRWLKPGGVLLFLIPGDRLAECSQILSTHFRDVRVHRLEGPECVRYDEQAPVLEVVVMTTADRESEGFQRERGSLAEKLGVPVVVILRDRLIELMAEGLASDSPY